MVKKYLLSGGGMNESKVYPLLESPIHYLPSQRITRVMLKSLTPESFGLCFIPFPVINHCVTLDNLLRFTISTSLK